jgi:hypothetical protein
MADDVAAHARAATLELVRDALRSGDMSGVVDVLAPDVRWYGTGPGGGCRNRSEVLDTLLEAFATNSARPHLGDSRIAGDRVVLHITTPDDDGGVDERWFVLTLDERGLIGELQAYSSKAAAEHDLAIHAAGPQPPQADDALPSVSALVPFVNVTDIGRSLRFYLLLGFEPLDTYPSDGEATWAFLRSGGATVMLARTDVPIAHRAQEIFFYLYTNALDELRDQLVAEGLAPGEIVDGTPGPRRQMLIADPDGYVFMIAQIEPDLPADEDLELAGT